MTTFRTLILGLVLRRFGDTRGAWGQAQFDSSQQIGLIDRCFA